MHSIRPRPICRAHNTFSPSVALWQHFVAPNQHLSQRPLKSSFVTEAAQTRDDDNVDSNQEGAAAELDPTLSGQVRNPPLRKIRIASPNFVLDPKLHPNFRNRGKNTPQNDGQKDKKKLTPYRGDKGQDAEKLLIRASDAYDSSQDYEGVVVQPIFSPPIQEYRYPWVIGNRESIKTGEER